MEVENALEISLKSEKPQLDSSVDVFNIPLSGGLGPKQRHEADGKHMLKGGRSAVGVVKEVNGEGRPRKKHRRGSKKNKPRKKRDWKPYDKLTWDEKRQLDEEDAVKAIRKREELVLQKGRPIAPYNTTQFLMEEHDPGNANFQSEHRPNVEKQFSIERTSENDFSDTSSSSDEYFEKDFDEVYETAHVEQLHSMTKDELVKSIMELEQKLEHSEQEKQKLGRTHTEIILDNERLKAENGQLSQEIFILRQSTSNTSLSLERTSA